MSWYGEKLKDSRWQKKRLEVLSRDDWKCLCCKRGENGGVCLHVHHSYYQKNKAPWEYNTDTLVTLCAECHEREPRAMEYCLINIPKSIINNGFTSMHAFEIRGLIEELSSTKKTDLHDLLVTLQVVAHSPILAKIVRAVRSCMWDAIDDLLVEYYEKEYLVEQKSYEDYIKAQQAEKEKEVGI